MLVELTDPRGWLAAPNVSVVPTIALPRAHHLHDIVHASHGDHREIRHVGSPVRMRLHVELRRLRGREQVD